MLEKKRLISLDAFRGLTIVLMLLVNNAGDWDHVFGPIEHAAWHGCTVADLVFPFFVFIMGVAMPMGKVAPLPYPNIIRRTVILFGLGVILSAVAYWAYMDHFRLMGVLQRLALTYFLLANIILFNKRSLEITLFCLLLILYGGALIFYAHFTGDSALAFPMYYNLPDLIDTQILGSMNYEFDKTLLMGHDPEGIFSTITTLCTGLAGVIAGRMLTHIKIPHQTFLNLVKLGLSLIMLGLVLNFIIPFNKNIWTPSYVVYTSGVAFLVLGFFYYLIDIKKYFRPHYPLIAYGSNAITMYFAASVLAMITVGIKWMDGAGQFIRLKTFLYKESFASYLSPHLGDYLPSALWGINYVILFFFLASLMYQKKWFVKI